MGILRLSSVVVVLVAALLMVAPAARADGNVADLAATVTAQSEVGVGAEVVTNIALINAGPDVATGAYFTAKLSGPGQYYPALSSPECKFDGPSVSCKLGQLPVLRPRELQLYVNTTGPGTIVQDWALTASQDDPIADNSGTVTTAVVVPTEDLAASITSSATAFSGETLSSTATATDLGITGFIANGVILTDTFSGPVTFDAVASDPRCSASGQTVTCNAGTLYPLQGGSDYLCEKDELYCARFNIAFALTGPGTVLQTVDVSADLPDPNPSNNTASATTTVQPAADLNLSLVSSPATTSYTYQELEWQLNVANQGPDAPTAVVVTGTLSGAVSPGQPGPSWDPSRSSPGCSISGATITCSIGSLGVGGATALDVAALPGVGTVVASFTVTSELPDLSPSDNLVTPPTVTVLPSTDLGVAVDGVTATPGAVTVQFVATNFGPDDVAGVGWNFTWSPFGTGGASFAAVTGTTGPCVVRGGGQPLLCGSGATPNGGSTTVDLTLTAPSGTTVTITVSVTGNVGIFDPNQSNNSASVTVVVP